MKKNIFIFFSNNNVGFSLTYLSANHGIWLTEESLGYEINFLISVLQRDRDMRVEWPENGMVR